MLDWHAVMFYPYNNWTYKENETYHHYFVQKHCFTSEMKAEAIEQYSYSLSLLWDSDADCCFPSRKLTIVYFQHISVFICGQETWTQCVTISVGTAVKPWQCHGLFTTICGGISRIMVHWSTVQQGIPVYRLLWALYRGLIIHFATEVVCFLNSLQAPVKWLAEASHVTATPTGKRKTGVSYVWDINKNNTYFCDPRLHFRHVCLCL